MRVKIRHILTTVLLVLATLAGAGGLSYGYWHLVDFELSGYHGIKQYELERNEVRERRRRMIPGVPAMRERILAKEFGDLPEAQDIRTDLRFVKVWQYELAGLFGLIAAGTLAYLLWWRRKRPWRRLLICLVVLAGCSQALPMLLLPQETLTIFYRYGFWVVLGAGGLLLVDAVVDRARPAAAAAQP